jgi:hypothetical protein
MYVGANHVNIIVRSVLYSVYNICERASSTDSDVDDYVTIIKLLYSILKYDENQNRHSGGFVEYTGTFVP